MTNPSMFSRRGALEPRVPRGDVLGTYETYAEAQQVIGRLAHSDFDVKRLSIVGNDLKTVERVTGKLTYGRTALAGALSGAWFGLFMGLVFFIFSPTPNPSVVFSAVLIGAGFGMLFSLANYAVSRRRRDFTSTHQVIASNYQIVVDPALTAQAQALLGQTPSQE
ncbi:hypothetical protein QF206_11895 [Klugiella sp. YN-L-19]|uniref:General stress protein 17M-like domain-containing protein n=2 Tax=Ruicaihuangia caeni TaxID=3042517 RepID=A0AAW6T780_9MICO|nr:hypothetical protein [Klugiella sp. YN-L-19]